MKSIPVVKALVTFLTPQEGGRTGDTFDSDQYRPHLVVGDPDQRAVSTDDAGTSTEDYLGVQFTGPGSKLVPGESSSVTLGLVYHPRVDYSALVPGATFTIREGGTVVGYGRVVEELPNKPMQANGASRRR